MIVQDYKKFRSRAEAICATLTLPDGRKVRIEKYRLEKNVAQDLENLNINSDNFAQFEGNHVQQYLHEEIVNTDNTWKSFFNKAYRGIPIDKKEIPYYCVVGPGDYINGNKYPWGWKMPVFDDSSWEKSAVIGFAHAKDTRHCRNEWMLTPANIPPMENSEV